MTNEEVKVLRADFKLRLADLSKVIKAKEIELAELSAMYDKAYEKCPHVLVCSKCRKQICNCKKNEWGTGWLECGICGSHIGGWYCQKSPDCSCHYYTEEDSAGRFYVKMNNCEGTRVYMGKDHDKEYETDDSCLFCGLPDERK